MNKRKETLIKARDIVFYSPKTDDLTSNSSPSGSRSKRFLKDDPSIKLKTLDSGQYLHTDETILTTGDILPHPAYNFREPTEIRNDKKPSLMVRKISNEDKGFYKTFNLQKKKSSKASLKEVDEPLPISAREKSSMNELIENTLTRENRSSLEKVYKTAREFKNLKLGADNAGHGDRPKGGDKLTEDKFSLTLTNLQHIRTDISHILNEKPTKTPRQQVILPEIQEQFKMKFTKLLQDINDEDKLSPDREHGCSSHRETSNLIDNHLKTSQFFNCETSPSNRNRVFNDLHKDIRSVQTPLMQLKHIKQPSNEKVQTQTSFMGRTATQYKGPFSTVDLSNDKAFQTLKKELPNLFSSHPSNRQEVLYLGNWLINEIKGIQDDHSLPIKEKFIRTDKIYNICFNELVRQVSFDCIERAELIMKIWKAYINLSNDIIDDFKAKEIDLLEKTNSECEKIHETYKKMLEEKDHEIVSLREELRHKKEIIRDKDDRINRFNEDQIENINQARHAKDAFMKIQKLYEVLKLEHKDMSFKFDRLKNRLHETAGEDSFDLERHMIINYPDSDSSSDAGNGIPFAFGNAQQKVVKMEDKVTSVADLAEPQEAMKTEEVAVQTKLSLMSSRFNPLLKSVRVLDEILRDQGAKAKLIHEARLIPGMKEGFAAITQEYEDYASARLALHLARSTSQNTSDYTPRSPSKYKININNEAQPEKKLENKNTLLVPASPDRRNSAISVQSEMINSYNRLDDFIVENDLTVQDPNQLTDPLEESTVEGKKTKKKRRSKNKLTQSNSLSPPQKIRHSTMDFTFGQKKEFEGLLTKLKKSSRFGKPKGFETSRNTGKLEPLTSLKVPTSTGVNALVSPRNATAKKHDKLSIIHEDRPGFRTMRNSKGHENFSSAFEEQQSTHSNQNPARRNSGSPKAGQKKREKPMLLRKQRTLELPNAVEEQSPPTSKKDDSTRKIYKKKHTKSISPRSKDNIVPRLQFGTIGGDSDTSSNDPGSTRDKPIKTTAGVINKLRRMASSDKVGGKKATALEAIAETLGKIDEDNEAAAQLIENQEHKIIAFSALYEIEKQKQEDLRHLNKELEKQMHKDGDVIENFQELVEELGQQTEFTETQKKKVETITKDLEMRTKTLEVIEELKPKMDLRIPITLTQAIKKVAEASHKRLLEEHTLARLVPPSQYKGQMMVDVILSNGQKHFLMEKISNPGHTILQKVKKDLQLGKAKYKICLPLKSVLKQISMFYNDKINQGKESPMLREQDMGTFVYKQFINTYGFQKFGIQKFVKFIVSVRKHNNIQRVYNFGRIIGIEGENNFTVQESRQYLLGLEFFLVNPAGGVYYSNFDNQKIHCAPFTKALEYLRIYAEKYGQEQDLLELRRDLEKYRIVDPTRVNVAGLVDVDILLEKVIAKHKLLMLKAEVDLLTAFNAADFLKLEKIKFADLMAIYRAIEGDKSEDKQLEEIFISNADIVEDEGASLSKGRFMTLSFDYNMFTKQKLNSFLEVKDDIEFEKKFEDFRGKWAEEFVNVMSSVEKKRAVLPPPIINKWRSILELIDLDVDKSESYVRKAALIRFNILVHDLNNNVGAGGQNA